MNLPYPISVNRYWRRAGNKTYVSKEAIAYKYQVKAIAKSAGIQIMQGPVEMSVVFHPKLTKKGTESKTRLDLDNVFKVLADSLNFVAYVDDKQIRRVLAEVGNPIEGGGLTVFITEYQYA